MSSTLFYRPVRPKDTILGTGLKLLLRKAYGEPVDIELGPFDIPKLVMLKVDRPVALSEEIDDLIKVINTYGAVHLYEGNW